MSYNIFIKKAENFLAEAKEAFVKERYDVCAFNAGQSAINANDAITINFLGKRARKDHFEALKLMREVSALLTDSDGRKYLRALLDARRIYGYSEKECSKKESERLIRLAEKLLSWVRKHTN